MASRLTSAWYTTALRGVAALGLALVCVARTPETPAFRADVFGTYALADGILCGLAVIATRDRRGGRGSALPLLAGAVGLGVGMYLLATPRLSEIALALAMAAWGLAAGIVALAGGYALYRWVPGPTPIVALGSGVRVRQGAATERGMLLAGAVALAFALSVLTLAAAGTTVSLAIVGLFAAIFGYLHLRAGLTLGVLALATAEPAGHSALRGVPSELEEGTA